MNTKPVPVYLSLGSNLGNRRNNLEWALKALVQQVRIIRCSSVYDTAPQEKTDQPRFLNMVVHAETSLPPESLLELAKGIETKLGRTAGQPNDPRPIDIDIIFYGKLVRNSPNLTIPHPRLVRRAFVLFPLAEIAPHLRHPTTNNTVRSMLRGLHIDEQDVVKYEEEVNV